MLERNIFGSTLSLGGLLNENLFTDGEADQFLQEMGVQASRGFGEPAITEAHSGANSFESALSGLGTIEDTTSFPPGSSEVFPGLFPTLNSSSHQPVAEPTVSQDPLQPPPVTGPQQGLAILGQLLAALGSASQQLHSATPQETLKQPQPQPAANYAAAFKPSSLPGRHISTVPQVEPQAERTGNPKLPNLNAQQQQALQTIMNFGQLGSTKEGKKVRRMLSNRESARRSRHRKQAHVLEIEEKGIRMEAENEALKLAIAKASEQEARLCGEIAALRTKVEQLEQQCKSAKGGAKEQGASLSSTQGAVSTDSCCESVPAKRPRI